MFKTYNEELFTYPSFKNNIFPSREDIDESEIKGLFETYVPMGEFIGLKRIYYNDTCIFTNQKRNEITALDYSQNNISNCYQQFKN